MKFLCRSALILVLFFSTVVSAATNWAPTASAQNVATDEDVALNITLTGSDPEGAALTYSIATSPNKGTLSCSGESCIYVPAANVNGSDGFYFKVSDGTNTSRTARIGITINAVNDAPVVADAAADVGAGEGVSMTLQGSDEEGSALTYVLVGRPSEGVATITGNTLVYTARGAYSGADSLTFMANDGAAWSSPGTVSVNVVASDTVVPILMEDLELLTSVTTEVDGDTTVVTMASDENCSGFMATPLVLPVQLSDGSLVEAAVAALHSSCLGYADTENYNFLIRTDTGEAYRFASEGESDLRPNAQASGVYDAATGTLVTPLIWTNTGTEEDVDEPTGGLMIQKDGETLFVDSHGGSKLSTSLIEADGVILASTDNTNQPTCQTGAKINAWNCGIWAAVDAATGELLDKARSEDDATYAADGYEAWYTAALTRAIVRDRSGRSTYDRLAWGTGPGGNNWDSDLGIGGACRAYLVNKEDFLGAVYSDALNAFDFFAADPSDGAVSYDPGDVGCVSSNVSSPNLSTDAIQGELTVGFDVTTNRPTYWAKGYLPDVSGSSYTRLSQLDENFTPICDVMINSGTSTNPFNGVNTGVAVASDGSVYANANYRDSRGFLRTSLFAINPTDCTTTTLVDMAASGTASYFSGVTLAENASGATLVLAASGGYLYAYDVSTNVATTYALGSATSDKITAAPVIDGEGRVIVVSASNIMTIISGLDVSYGDHFWPRFRKDNFGTGTAEIRD